MPNIIRVPSSDGLPCEHLLQNSQHRLVVVLLVGDGLLDVAEQLLPGVGHSPVQQLIESCDLLLLCNGSFF